MTDKETMKFTLRVIEQIITTGLDSYTYDSVMCDPRHPINQARHLLQEALTPPKETQESCFGDERYYAND